MITFTDLRLYIKGTCNVILSDPEAGDIYYPDNNRSGRIRTSRIHDSQ